jgi:hypothetical protein
MMYEVTKPIVKLEHHPAQKDMAAMVPIGTITVMMPNHKNPPGWVEAYGQRLSKHAYPDAAALFKPRQPKWWQLVRRYEAWKLWERDGEFQVPDLRGHAPVASS